MVSIISPVLLTLALFIEAITAQDVTVMVEIKTDDHPTETSWSLIDVCPDGPGVVGTGGGYTVAGGTETTALVTRQSRFLFVIVDAGGDGICCNTGPAGYYKVSVDDVERISGGEFDINDNQYFGLCTTPTTSKPTNVLSASPTNNPTTQPTNIGAPTYGNVTISVDIKFDNFPDDITWLLSNICYGGSKEVGKGGDYAQDLVGKTETVYSGSTSDGSFKFVINDSFGDGLCCSHGPGEYTINYGATEITSGFEAKFEEVQEFGSEDKCELLPPSQKASYDSSLGVPKCGFLSGVCTTTGTGLLNCKTVSDEPNGPNSLDTCLDGSDGVCEKDESIEDITVTSSVGVLSAGTNATIRATIFAFGNGEEDQVDFYHTTNPGPNPTWKYISSARPSSGGLTTVESDDFVLQSSDMQAVRVVLRWNGIVTTSPQLCSDGGYDEVDDLVFAVANYCTIRVADQMGWANWFGEIETFSPVFRIKTDEELQKIIKISRKVVDSNGNRCKIRVTGAGHTEDGLVMQREEPNVVIISLVDHLPDDQTWRPSADPETGLVRLLSGMSWYDAVVLYRPLGLVQRERAGGRFFSVGGVIANPVHGGSKSGGFIHSDVTKMLVMTSDAKMHEIEGDELNYWRSSAGQLGVIIAVEMQLIREVDMGGSLNMHAALRTFGSLFADPSNPTSSEIGALVGAVSQEVYSVIAASDHNEFFYDFYQNQLASYYTDFTGPKFNAALSAQYAASAQIITETFGQDAAFNGGSSPYPFPDDLCEYFCVPGTGGPPFGDGSTPCVPIPSSSDPSSLLCNNALEVGAVLSDITIQSTREQFLGTGASVNDGYLTNFAVPYKISSLFIPSRALPQIFASWWQATALAVAAYVNPGAFPQIPFRYAPLGLLEFRFISPQGTSVMNPVPSFGQWKEDFDNAYFGSFDSFFPPVPGVPDGLIGIEILSFNVPGNEDVDKYFFFLEQAWQNTPSNPLAPYDGNKIIPDCDPKNNVVICASVNNNDLPPFASPIDSELPCCNPRVPVTFHIAKGWGHGVDPETTPTTGKLVPFHDNSAINMMFGSPGKASSIKDFNAKIEEYDSDVFVGGALLRWLRPEEAWDYEPRKLKGQTCASPEYVSDPGAECISGTCDVQNSYCD